MSTTLSSAKPLPFDLPFVQELAKTRPTPFYLYDEAGIRRNARQLNAAFAWAHNFREYFAVKATPNPALLKILAEEGCGMDCSSLAELVLSERVGVGGPLIMFTSNNTAAHEYVKAKELGAVINLDDISHIDYLAECAGLPDTISFRFNPGPARSGNTVIGKPEQAKFGLTRKQLFDAYATLKLRGVGRFGLHTMVASNVLESDYFIETARMLFELVREVHRELGVRIEFVNLGGGLGIPYRPTDNPVDLTAIGEGIRQEYDALIAGTPLEPLQIMMENGRFMTGPYGFLVTKAIHAKSTYKNYIGVDSCMANLMRPGMYGAYHHITVLGKEQAEAVEQFDVVGSLCENNDKFAVDRPLPQVARGDFLVLHDAGAHGHSMGFQYNGKLRCAELLLCEDGSVRQIRRAETLDDYFATLT